MRKIYLPSIDSTNTWVKEHYQELSSDEITRVSAGEQTGGRGRFNRSWVSPKDQNIYVTYYFTLPKESKILSNLTQVLSLSITSLLKELDLDPQIKWPNDLLVNEKKIGGILCETIDMGTQYGIAIGAGINVNMPLDVLDTIDQRATSIYNELGERFTLDPLIDRLDQLFFEDLSLLKTKGFAAHFSRYNSLLAFKNEPVTLNLGAETLQGTLHSIKEDGRLNLLLPSGEIKTVSSGDLNLQH